MTDVNTTTAQAPTSPSTLDGLFWLSVETHPDTEALVWSNGQLTYRELANAVNTMAQKLHGARRVAVFNDRSPLLAISVLATLTAGAAYVPMDTTYPDGRLEYMVANSEADLLVCTQELAERLELPPTCRRVIVDETMIDGQDDHDSATPVPTTRPEDLAYISYTSGSTGRPKGVAMSHRSLANLATWQVSWSRARNAWRTLQLSPLSVDISFQELFATWASGGTVVLVEDDTRRDPVRLLGHLDLYRIDRMFCPFVMLQEIVASASQRGVYPRYLREVITLGEQLQCGADLKRFFTATGATLENQYGTTETHVVTAERLSESTVDWPALPSVGRAISNTLVQVVDENLDPLPVGTDGEIGISGVAVADGYIGLPDMTKARFRETTDGRGRIYMTGDFGRELPDGRIQYLGRRDNQIKVQGFRVELAEIETLLRETDGVADAVVTVRHDSDEPALVAHCVPTPSAPADVDGIRDVLRQALPAYMVPSEIRLLERFPFTPTGKVDRAGLS